MRVSGYDLKGVSAGLFEYGEIPDEVADLQLGQSMLTCAEEFTRSSQFKIHFCNLESIAGLSHNFQPFACLIGFGISKKQAVRLLASPANASAQLVELCKSEPFRMLYNHYGGVGYVCF